MGVTYHSNLLKIRDGLPEAIDQGLGVAAGMIGDLAQQLAPVDTGALRDSKRVERVKAAHYRVRFTAPYAAFVEYGTIHSPAQPFLTPAAQAIDVEIEVGKAVDALIRRNGV